MKIKVTRYQNQISKSVQNINNLEFLVGRENMNFRSLCDRYLEFTNVSDMDSELRNHSDLILQKYPELIDDFGNDDILGGFVVSMYIFAEFCQKKEVTIGDQLILKKGDNLYKELDRYIEKFWDLGRQVGYQKSFVEVFDFVKKNYIQSFMLMKDTVGIGIDSLLDEYFGFSLFYMSYLITYVSFEMSSDNLLMVG